MAFASGSGRRVALIAESVWGTTPTSPTFKTMRVTGGGMRTNKSTAVSDEIRADRNVADEILLGQDVAGAYDFEMSYGGPFDDLWAGALFGSWSDDVLKNGVTPTSFTVEETLELGATDSFQRMVGARVNSLSLAIAARQKVTGTINMMARRETLATSILSGATYTAAPVSPIFSASAHVASLSLFEFSPQPKIRSLNLEINNNLRTRPVIASQFSEEFGEGRCEVTGNLEAYFESNALYQAVLDHGSGELEFKIGVDEGERYLITLPKIIFGSGERVPAGNDQDIMVNIPFRAVYSADDSCTIQVTRAVDAPEV